MSMCMGHEGVGLEMVGYLGQRWGVGLGTFGSECQWKNERTKRNVRVQINSCAQKNGPGKIELCSQKWSHDNPNVLKNFGHGKLDLPGIPSGPYVL